MSRALGVLALLVTLLSGCGPEAGLWVRVEAPLLVPEEADGLRITARRASGAVAFDQTWQLEAVGAFPQTLALYEWQGEALEEGVLELEVWVLRGESLAAPWSHAKVNATLQRGRLEEVMVRLCDCGDGT